MDTSLHWCSFKHFPRADAFPSLLVHNLVWGWVTLILEASLNTLDIKNSKVYFGFKSMCSAVGNLKIDKSPLAAPENFGGQSYQYIRLLSPSDMLFIVKSGTLLDPSLVRLALEDSFNSPRQCEVYRIITGAWETVTVTLGVHWILFLTPCQSRVVWWERWSWWCLCVIGRWGWGGGEAWASQAVRRDLALRQSAAAPFFRCLGDLYFGCKLCYLQYWSLL